MLLTISTTHAPATELGYLLFKNPWRVQSFDLTFGRAHNRQRLNALAAGVMAEAGADIGAQRAKHVYELSQIDFDYVVTVCGNADENCPVFPEVVRRLRDEIRAWVETLPESLVTAVRR